jgi:lysophospholipase L1-like esterase
MAPSGILATRSIRRFLALVALGAALAAPAVTTAAAGTPPPPAKLRPAPLVSLGAWTTASAKDSGLLVDGRFRGATWGGGQPTPARPAWAAIRLQRPYRKLLLTWTSSHNHDYFEQFYGAPRDYRIETSADSTDGQDGSWTLVIDVKDNPVRSRAHAVPFAGQRWVRMVMTRLPDKVSPWGLFLDEIELHDLSSGGDDVWVFLGDSISAGVFDRADPHRPSFAESVAALYPGYTPAMINAGLPRLRSWEAIDRVDEVLALNPEATVVAITLGSNDADLDRLRAALGGIISKVQAAGKIPLLARIPFQTKYDQDYVAVKNQVIDQLVRERGLLPGPDLYGWFKARPGRLHDGLHPDGPGSVDMSREFALSAAPLYPPASDPSP